MSDFSAQLALIAEFEVEYCEADYVCRQWQEACGSGIWREGHPSDMRKLERRGEAKRRLRFERRRLADMLALASVAGAA